MTEVICEKSLARYRIRAYGHAVGSKDVCNAVSVTLYNLADFLVNSNRVRISRMKLEPGEAEIEFSGLKTAKDAFELTETAFFQLEHNFPKHIRVKELKFFQNLPRKTEKQGV